MQATSDFLNQEIFKMARSFDPSGVRTVVVITKPDRVERGNEEHVSRGSTSSDLEISDLMLLDDTDCQ